MTDRIETYRDQSGDHRWRYVIPDNDDVLADSGEGYRNIGDMSKTLDRVFGGEPPVIVMPDGTVRNVPADPLLGAALTLLTLITGDEWNRSKLVSLSDNLKQTAIDALVAKGIERASAEDIVEQRWEAYGSPHPTAQSFAADKPMPPMGRMQPPAVADLRARARDFAQRREQQAQTNPRNGDDTPAPPTAE